MSRHLYSLLQKSKGFTLIELLIVVAIIGVLGAIAYPSYREYVTQARRSEGIAKLMEVMQQQERFFTERLSYSTDLTELGYTVDIDTELLMTDGGHYGIVASNCAILAINRCVSLTATPQGMQVPDGDLTLNSIGERGPASAWQ